MRCDESAQLHQLITDLANKLGVHAEPASVYQRQIETVLERAVEIKKLFQSEKASVTGADKALSSLELKILAAVSKRQRATSSDIASDVNLSEDAARFYLDEMARGNLINWFGSSIPSMPSEYMLAHEGRRHLVKKETSNTLITSKPVLNGDTFFFEGQGPYCTACWENSQKQISLKEAPHYEQRLTGFSLTAR